MHTNIIAWRKLEIVFIEVQTICKMCVIHTGKNALRGKVKSFMSWPFLCSLVSNNHFLA